MISVAAKESESVGYDAVSICFSDCHEVTTTKRAVGKPKPRICPGQVGPGPVGSHTLNAFDLVSNNTR